MIWRKNLAAVLWGIGLALIALTVIPALGADEPAKQPPTPPPAQSGPGRPAVMVYMERFQSAVDGLKKLTDEQKQKTDGFFQTATSDIKALEDTKDAGERTQKARAVIDKLRKDVGEVLSTEQKLEVRAKMQPPGPGAIIDRIKQQLEKPELKLTDDQRKKVDDVLDDTRKKLDDLRAEAKAGNTNVGAKLRDIIQDMRQKLNAILSPDQQQQINPPPAAKPDSSRDQPAK